MEFTTIQREVAVECLELLVRLGYRAFNACFGESMAFEHAVPIGLGAMRDWLRALPAEANSGDIYASLEPRRITG